MTKIFHYNLEVLMMQKIFQSKKFAIKELSILSSLSRTKKMPRNATKTFLTQDTILKEGMTKQTSTTIQEKKSWSNMQ